MSLPNLTGLQYLILSTIRSGETSGQSIRTLLEKHGEAKSGPAFYQLMNRLEEAGYVQGRYSQAIIDKQLIRERCYTATDAGQRAWEQTRDFYSALAVDVRQDDPPQPPDQQGEWAKQVSKRAPRQR